MSHIEDFLKVIVRLGILPPLFMWEEILKLPANILSHLNDALYDVTAIEEGDGEASN